MFEKHKLNITIIAIGLVMTLNIGVVIAANVNDVKLFETKEVIAKKYPSSAQKFIDRAYDGQRLSFIKNGSEDWERVKSLNNLFGMVYSDLLNTEIIDEVSKAQLESEKKEIEAAIKKETSTKSSGGNKVVDNSNGDLSPGKIVGYAKTWLGNDYTYGGADPSTGFDCSGFVNYVYKHFGVKITRSSRTIANDGKGILFKDIRPSDILIFEKSGRIYHAGIYIGNNKFIHSQSEKTGVCISSVAPGTTYHTRINTIRRVY